MVNLGDNPAEDEYNFQAAFTLLRIGGIILLLFLLFVMGRIKTSGFPYSPESMKKFVNAATAAMANTK